LETKREINIPEGKRFVMEAPGFRLHATETIRVQAGEAKNQKLETGN
jgi:hypothetical protein